MKAHAAKFMGGVALLVVIVGSLAFLHGCGLMPQSTVSPDRSKLGANLVHLTRTLEGVVRDNPSIADADLLTAAGKEDASLLVPFQSVYVSAKKVEANGRKFAVAMVCTKQGGNALLEDISCTAGMDIYRQENSPCDFTIDTAKASDLCTLKK